MFHKIKSVVELSDHILLVTFDDNVIKYYDVKPLLEKLTEFKNSENIKGLFELVKIVLEDMEFHGMMKLIYLVMNRRVMDL